MVVDGQLRDIDDAPSGRSQVQGQQSFFSPDQKFFLVAARIEIHPAPHDRRTGGESEQRPPWQPIRRQRTRCEDTEYRVFPLFRPEQNTAAQRGDRRIPIQNIGGQFQ